MDYIFKENTIHLYFNKSLYTLDALFKCIYWYGNNWNIVIDEHPEKIEYYALNISPKSEDLSLDHNKVKLFVSKFINDINDYQLRDIITKETKNIRDLLVAKAFSSGEFDEEPPGEFEDFLGTVQ